MAKRRLGASFSARTALPGLEIRQDSRVRSPCLAKKSAPIPHSATFQTRPDTKIHLAVDAHGMPVRFFITSGTTADCTVAAQLIEGFQAEYLLADRGYDTDAIILKAVNEGMIPVIPPRKNRKHLREYDEYLYKLRHLVENAFLLLKKWRGIATRYAKNASSFAAAVQIRCIAIWLLVY